MYMMKTKFFLKIVTILCYAAIPIFLVSTNVQVMKNSTSLYEYGFNKYSVHSTTGITKNDLPNIADQITEYFNDQEEFLALRVDIYGIEQPLFSEKEILHMRDVKNLFKLVVRAQAISGIIIITYIIFGILSLRKDFIPKMMRTAWKGSIISLLGFIIIGIALAIAFPVIFLTFHELSFRNDLWILDPATDKLIQLFPAGFWSDAAILLAITSIFETILIAATSYIIIRTRASQ